MKKKQVRASSVLLLILLALGLRGLGNAEGQAAFSLKNWGLMSPSAESGPRADIHAIEAWKLLDQTAKQTQLSDVLVAVIDTGIDPEHRDLKTQLWKKPGVTAPLYGWDFTKDRANPVDVHGHGTHVAGIIGAVLDSPAGVSGVARKVSIMPVKYYAEGATGAVNLRNTVAAINFAVDNGARIINYSGGGPEFSEDEYLAIRKAEAKGVLFVAAAGNDHRDIDKVSNYYYPSAYRLSNIISVAATDMSNNLLRSSNWGGRKVDIAAPGERIYSTTPGNKFDYMSGTSQATAFVTGVAAILLSIDPTLKPQEVRELIVGGAERVPQLKDKTLSGGKLDAFASIRALQTQMELRSGPHPKRLLATKKPSEKLSP